MCTTLSVSPNTVPAKGTLTVSWQDNSADTIFAQVKLNGKIIKVLRVKDSRPEPMFTIDTSQYKDGGYFLILETIDSYGNETKKPYYLLIGNNTEELQRPNPPGQVAHLISSLYHGEGQQDEGSDNKELREILLTAERLQNDIEADTLIPLKYSAQRSHLQFLSDTEGYPVPLIPFTASRVLGLLSERAGDYTAAENYYHQNLINYPGLYDTKTTGEYLRILTGAEDTGKAVSSARRLKHSLERQKGQEQDIRTRYLIAVLEKQSGNTTRAEQLFKEMKAQAVSLTPSLPSTLRGEGQDEGAIIKGGVKVTDGNPILHQWVRYQLAVIDKEKGEYDKAIEIFNDLLQDTRERIDDYARFQLGESYYLKRDFRQALPYYEKIALTHSPTEDRPFALYQTGICCIEMKQPDKAGKYLAILNKDYPRHKITRQGMYLYAEARYSASRNKRWSNDPTVELETITATLKQVIERYPNTKEAEDSYYLISQSIREVTDELNKRGQYSAAKRVYAKLVGEETVGIEKKEGDKTNTEMEIQLQEKETNPIIRNYLQLADKLYGEQKYAEAIKMYQRILQESPRSSLGPWVQFQTGICYAGMREYEKAITELIKVADKYPKSDYADGALERAGTYLSANLEDVEGGIKIYQRIIEEYPEGGNAPLAQYLLGALYMRTENWEEAKKAFQKVIEKYPGTDLSARAKNNIKKTMKRDK